MDTDCTRSGCPRMHANDVNAAYLPLCAKNAIQAILGTISKSANTSHFRIKVPCAGAHVMRPCTHPRASCAPHTRAYVMHPRANTRNPRATHILTHTPAYRGCTTQPKIFQKKFLGKNPITPTQITEKTMNNNDISVNILKYLSTGKHTFTEIAHNCFQSLNSTTDDIDDTMAQLERSRAIHYLAATGYYEIIEPKT